MTSDFFLSSLASAAAKELQRDHGIALSAIAERLWKQFYIRRLGPEAAERAATEYTTRDDRNG